MDYEYALWLHEMIVLNKDFISILCFHDTHVETIEMVQPVNILKFYVSHASIVDISHTVFLGTKGSCLGKGVLVFENWNELSVYSYNEFGEEPIALEETKFESIRDIATFDEYNDCVKIGGFGIETGHWVEWVVKGSNYYGIFNES